MKDIKKYIDTHQKRFLDELIDLLKIPSISADKAYKDEVFNTADAVAERLKEAGCAKVEICETPGYPIVYKRQKPTYYFSVRALRCATARSNGFMG